MNRFLIEFTPFPIPYVRVAVKMDRIQFQMFRLG